MVAKLNQFEREKPYVWLRIEENRAIVFIIADDNDSLPPNTTSNVFKLSCLPNIFIILYIHKNVI